jgi:hypothetical protein
VDIAADYEFTSWGGQIGEATSSRVVVELEWQLKSWETRLVIPFNGDQPIWINDKDSSDFRIRQRPLGDGYIHMGHDHLYDIQLDVVKNGWGVSMVFHNSEDGTAARGQYLLGPQYKNDWVRITHHNNVFDNGDSDIDTNMSTLQLYFPLGKRLYTRPKIEYDWEGVSDNRLLLPINLGVRLGSLMIEVDYYVQTPSRFGPEWKVRFRLERS